MKKTTVFILVGLLAGAVSFLPAAAEMKKDRPMDKKAKHEMVPPNKMMCMCPMHCTMMKMLMDKTVVATSDGGVVVMVGDKLFKYDKNLDLKKAAEIKMDIEGIRKKMQAMKEKCPGCKEMPGECGMNKKAKE